MVLECNRLFLCDEEQSVLNINRCKFSLAEYSANQSSKLINCHICTKKNIFEDLFVEYKAYFKRIVHFTEINFISRE